MARRKKRARLRGRRTAGWGARKKRRGKGSRGGRGMAGTGKRAGQLKTWMLRYAPDWLGRRGFVSLKQKRALKEKTISLGQLSEQLEAFLKAGIAARTAEGIAVELSGYKVLSQGSLKQPLIVKAASFSAKAKEKIERAGGKAIVK